MKKIWCKNNFWWKNEKFVVQKKCKNFGEKNAKMFGVKNEKIVQKCV